MIDSLISTTDKNKVINTTPRQCFFLRKEMITWFWENNMIRISSNIFQDVLDTTDDWFSFYEHTITSSIRHIIDLLVFIHTRRSWIDQRKRKLSISYCFCHQGSLYKTSEDIRKERNDMDVHGILGEE
jgi:hypothetical protein